MRLINKIGFVFKEFLEGLIKNLYKTLFQFLICFVSLFIVSLSIVGYFNVQSMTKGLEDKVRVNVYLKDDISEYDLNQIKDKASADSFIKKYEYVSKDAAKEEAKNQFTSDNKVIIDSIEGIKNPFPASLRIELKDATQTEKVAAQFKMQSGVDSVKFGGDTVDKLLTITNAARAVMISIFVFCFIISVFFMMAIISFILSTKTQEYHIMDMIGASKIQIKTPFYFQGIFLGALSALLSYFATASLYLFALRKFKFLTDMFEIISFDKISNMLFAVILLLGILTGIVATFIALSRFVKVQKKVRPKKKVKSFKVNKSSEKKIAAKM